MQCNLDLETQGLSDLSEGNCYGESIHDFTSRELLAEIPDDEQEHIDWLQTGLLPMEKIGRENCLPARTHPDVADHLYCAAKLFHFERYRTQKARTVCRNRCNSVYIPIRNATTENPVDETNSAGAIRVECCGPSRAAGTHCGSCQDQTRRCPGTQAGGRP